MKKYIKERIKQLRNEVDIISVANYDNNLKITKFERNRVFELRCKINILTEVLNQQ